MFKRALVIAALVLAALTSPSWALLNINTHVDQQHESNKIVQLQTYVNQYQLITDATTARTFSLADATSLINSTNASAATFTIPTNTTAAFPIGSWIMVLSSGAGGLTVAAAGGVTLNGTATLAQNVRKVVIKIATNTWHIQ
jgi:hypothetical protein